MRITGPGEHYAATPVFQIYITEIYFVILIDLKKNRKHKTEHDKISTQWQNLNRYAQAGRKHYRGHNHKMVKKIPAIRLQKMMPSLKLQPIKWTLRSLRRWKESSVSFLFEEGETVEIGKVIALITMDGEDAKVVTADKVKEADVKKLMKSLLKKLRRKKWLMQLKTQMYLKFCRQKVLQAGSTLPW
jgi:hypothetical protein